MVTDLIPFEMSDSYVQVAPLSYVGLRIETISDDQNIISKQRNSPFELLAKPGVRHGVDIIEW